MTYFEKLKEMEIEELEDFLCSKMDCTTCIRKFGANVNFDEMYECHDINDSVLGMWLKSEVKE